MTSATQTTERWYPWNPPIGFNLPPIINKRYGADDRILSPTDDAGDAAAEFRVVIFHIDSGEEEPLFQPSLLKVQIHINPQIRTICVYWLVYAAEILDIAPGLLHHGIDCFDRYVSGNVVDRKDLLFVGLSCLLTASTCRVGEKTDLFMYARLAKNRYSLEEFIEMKEGIMEYLEHKVRIPTTWSFVNKFVDACTAGGSTSMKITLGGMACYLAELSLLSRIMLRFRPSWVAASCVFLARYILFPLECPWDATLQQCTMYRPSHLRQSVLELHAFCYSIHVANLPIFRNKYSQQTYGRVALKTFPTQLPLELFQDMEFSLI